MKNLNFLNKGERTQSPRLNQNIIFFPKLQNNNNWENSFDSQFPNFF
jgi:hypothetical protein